MTAETIRRLLSAAAVRERAHEMLELALEGRVEGWRVDIGRLDEAAERTAAVTRQRYPDLTLPFHSRWRHLLLPEIEVPEEVDGASIARGAFDLVIVSVLLDAGAGPDWAYWDEGMESHFARSEGLGVASQRMFEAGVFSSRPSEAWRVDAEVLARLDTDTLADGFQVGETNPLVGLEGRAALLRRLGEQVAARPDLFPGGRPGGLYDVLVERADRGSLRAPAILELLLEALGPIWTDRLVLHGIPLGDCWRHPAIRRDDETDGLVPLHKLSQWLAYSLIEPLMAARIEVTDIDGLTGLAEYRNGGLFVDTGVLCLSDSDDMTRVHQVSDPLIVAWRAMTVALLDRLAPLVRELLGVPAQNFPLTCMLEGGTWAAGRRIAAERRPGGGPPFNIISDGTVF